MGRIAVVLKLRLSFTKFVIAKIVNANIENVNYFNLRNKQNGYFDFFFNNNKTTVL